MKRNLLALMFIALIFVIANSCARVATTTTTTTAPPTTIPSVYAPNFSVAPGTYEANSITVEVTSSTESAAIYYTTDGTTPDASSTLYVGTISIDTSTTLQAIAILSSDSSEVTTGRYNLTWWSAIGTGVAGASVNAIAVDSSGNVYIGGSFSSAGGVSASNIAMWDGTSWNPLGDGLNGTVWAITVGSDGNVYVGGEFGSSGTTTLNCVARWNTTLDAWEALNSGLNETVRSLFYISISGTGYVLCSGDFTGEGAGGGPDPLDYLGVYLYDDVPNWADLTGGANNICRAITYDPTYTVTYAGGDFTQVDTGPATDANYVAFMRGSTSWEALGTGVATGPVRALLYSSDNLFVAGDFVTAGGSTANRVAVWDTDATAWDDGFLGTGNSGFDDTVRALALDSSYLYAGGDFANNGDGTTAYARIAKWSLTSGTWSTMGSGMNGNVNAIAVDSSSGKVYAGGQFSLAGGASAFRIAVWGPK